MKLLITQTSPYARIARICVRELGLQNVIEERVVALRTAQNETLQHNPTGKVPTLLLDDDTVLSEAPIICRYLVGLSNDTQFIARSPSPAAQSLTGIVTGFVDGVSVWIREARRPSGEQSPDILRQERERASRCVRWFNDRTDALGTAVTYDTATIAVALNRLSAVSEASWRDEAPDLAAWADRMESLASFASTRPD